MFLAYRYAAHPAALKLEFSKNEFLPVPTAIVTYAVLNTTLTADRAETTEAIYWVRNNGRQFLSVVLPERGQMLSDVFVNGQPQQPSRRPDKNALLVRLPAARGRYSAAGADDAPVSVRLVYSVPGDPAGRGGLGVFGHLRVAPPVLEETRVLQTEYSLYLPPGYRYVNFDGPMREVYDRRGWNGLRDRARSLRAHARAGHDAGRLPPNGRSRRRCPPRRAAGSIRPCPRRGRPSCCGGWTRPRRWRFPTVRWVTRTRWRPSAFFAGARLGIGVARLAARGRAWRIFSSSGSAR